MIYAFSLDALLKKLKPQLLKSPQTVKKKLIKCNILQRSLQSSPPIYNNIMLKIKNPIDPDKAVNSKLSVSSPLTNGCKKAKTTKAIDKLINPLPSSKATFLSFIKKIIAKRGKQR